jgi:hypothetical protein
MDAIIWSLNITIQLLPLTTGTQYGMFDFWLGKLRCALTQNDDINISYVDLWNKISFSLQLMISFTWIAILSIIIMLYQYGIIKIGSRNVLNETYSTLLLYPAGMLVSWLPSMVYDWIWNSNNSKYGIFLNDGVLIVDSLATANACYGMLLAIIFYMKNEDARKEWMIIIRRVFGSCNNNNDEEIRSTIGRESEIEIRKSVVVDNPMV